MKKTPLAIGLLSIALIAMLIGWLSSRNSLFMLSEIVVKSESPEVEKNLQGELIALLGRRLTSLSLGQVEAILQKNPRVKRAVFHKRWPSTLEVAVEERKPVAMAFKSQHLWWVDENGEAFAAAEESSPYVLIKSFNKIQASAEVQEIAAWLAKNKKLDWIDEVEWIPERGLVARNVGEQIEAELGYRDFAAAWKRADYALKFLSEKKIRVKLVDASDQHRVIARLQGGLRNFENGLNLKELVRRTGKNPAAAR